MHPTHKPLSLTLTQTLTPGLTLAGSESNPPWTLTLTVEPQMRAIERACQLVYEPRVDGAEHGCAAPDSLRHGGHILHEPEELVR